MKIEALLTELDIAQEFTESLEARDLPEKFFYWFPLSVQAFRELKQNGSSASLDQAWDALGAKALPLCAHFTSGLPVISFGSGDGARDLRLLKTLRAGGSEVRYFPVDASQTLLEVATAAAEDEDIETLGIKADISSRMHLVIASDAAESPRLFLLAGNTLGGFDPLDQIKILAECMRPEDRLLIDAELYFEGALEHANRKESRRFALAPLTSIGVGPDDGEIRFDQKTDNRREGLYLITKYFQASRDLRLTVSGEEINLARGERIFLNFRYLYTPEAFEWLLGAHGGLKILDRSATSDSRYLAVIAARA